jgi:hypothetical protein
MSLPIRLRADTEYIRPPDLAVVKSEAEQSEKRMNPACIGGQAPVGFPGVSGMGKRVHQNACGFGRIWTFLEFL